MGNNITKKSVPPYFSGNIVVSAGMKPHSMTRGLSTRDVADDVKEEASTPVRNT